MLYPGKIWPGTSLRLTVSFTDADGTAVDPDTVTFSTFSPGGTSTDYVYDTDDEVGRSATGSYYADISPGESGRWHFRWLTTGTGTSIATEGDFIVQRSFFAGDTWPYSDYGWC